MNARRRAPAGAFLLVLPLVAAYPAPLVALQTGPAGAGPGPADARIDPPRVGCLHGLPRPACASFWLVELQASIALISQERLVGEPPFQNPINEGGTVYEWNLGHMANLDDTWAIGGAVSLGSGADEIFTGARARLRRWIGPSASLELEAGVARSNGNHTWYPDLTGVSAGLRFNVLDYGSAFLRYDGFGEPPERGWAGPVEPVEPGPRHLLRGGVGLGGKAALAATGAVAVIYGALIVALLGSGNYT